LLNLITQKYERENNMLCSNTICTLFPCIKKTQTTLQFHVNNVVKKRHLLYSILVPTLLILQQGII